MSLRAKAEEDNTHTHKGSYRKLSKGTRTLAHILSIPSLALSEDSDQLASTANLPWGTLLPYILSLLALAQPLLEASQPPCNLPAKEASCRS